MATFYQDAVRQIGSTESELHSFYKKLGRKDHVEFTQDLIEKTGGTRKEMASFLFRIVNCTLDCVKLLKSGCLEVDALKTESKCAMKDLAEVQSELLQWKRDQIEFIQAGVQKTIKTEMKSYSEAVQKSKGESVSLSKIKTAVKDIVEDRSRNVMIFGLAEADNENLHSKTLEVFEELNEKPFFKAERLGRKMEDSKSRPVKVTMDNPVVVSELLKKSRDLKNSTDYSAVYLKPDRTVEQRRKHRELVNELKQSIKDSPDKRHFIRNGEICHEENVKMDKADVPAKSVSSGPGVTKKKEKTRKILLPHHIAANRRPSRGYVSPVTTDSSDCD